MGSARQSTYGARVLPKNVKAIEAVRPEAKRTSYSIRGERGLRLIVHSTGRKVWFALYQIGKGVTRERRWHEIGTFPEFSLANACTEAGRVRTEVAKGGDPEEAKTFDELFQMWVSEHAKKKVGTWKDEEARYNRHLKADVGAKAYVDIERKDVRKIRDDVLEGSGPIESNRVVALFNRVMNWAVDEDRAKFNPAARLKKVGEERRRERVLTAEELKRIWLELDKPLTVDHDRGGLTDSDLKAAVAVRRAIKLLLVTAQRRGEVIGMIKSELDLAEGNSFWTIPGKRTKNGLPHRVPLTKTALEILQHAMEASDGDGFVFPSSKTEGPIRPDAVTKQFQRMCNKMRPKIEGVAPHDLRRTCGTEMRKLGVTVEDRGYVLNHVSGAKAKVTSWNYDAGEHDAEKRRALERWERQLRRVVGLDAAQQGHQA
jgi:integrase